MAQKPSRALRVVLWSTAIIVLIILAFTAWLVVPIVASSSAGSSGQPLGVEGYPSSVSATGDDGRTRTLSVTLENAQGRGLDQLVSGDRLVVTGQGYDPDKGIYVAVCAIPDQVDTKPGPCLGGVPSTEVLDQPGVAAIEFAPSNWVNDDWAWRLFGARSFDDRDQGSFSAYIEVGEDPESGVDCAVDACGLYTRNDHTALDDRVQDLYVPVLFVK